MNGAILSRTSYTSIDTMIDYERAKHKTLNLMKEPAETTSMEQIGATVFYKKMIHDKAENGSDAHWYEDRSVRTETLVIKETGQMVKRKTYIDLEYWGTSTDGKSHWVHKVVEEVF